MTNMKRALVCSGGSNKGIFHLGILKRLLEKDPNLDYDIYTGISVGAINVAVLASGPLKETLPKVTNIWFEDIKGNSSVWKHKLLPNIIWSAVPSVVLNIVALVLLFVGVSPWLVFLTFLLSLGSLYLVYHVAINTKSVFDTSPLRKIVERNLDPEALKKSGKEMRVGAVSYLDGNFELADQNSSNLIDWIMGSAAFPLFFPLQKIREKYYVDGGVKEMAALNAAVKMGATHVDVIVSGPLSGTSVNSVGGILAQSPRILELMSDEILKNDLRTHFDKIKIRIFSPSETLIDDSMDFSPEKLREMYQKGYESVDAIVTRYELEEVLSGVKQSK